MNYNQAPDSGDYVNALRVIDEASQNAQAQHFEDLVTADAVIEESGNKAIEEYAREAGQFVVMQAEDLTSDAAEEINEECQGLIEDAEAITAYDAEVASLGEGPKDPWDAVEHETHIIDLNNVELIGEDSEHLEPIEWTTEIDPIGDELAELLRQEDKQKSLDYMRNAFENTTSANAAYKYEQTKALEEGKRQQAINERINKQIDQGNNDI